MMENLAQKLTGNDNKSRKVSSIYKIYSTILLITTNLNNLIETSEFNNKQ